MLWRESDGGEAVARRADQPDQCGAERVRQVCGLILLALAGVGRVFTPGWWRLW